MKLFLAAMMGVLFGLGIAVSGMINPAKVLNFFDIYGTWDPSLFFVMAGAFLTTAIGYNIVRRFQSKPLYNEKFNIPTSTKIDGRLLSGAAMFGIGWGIAGFCPGGAIPALGLGLKEPLIFVGAMIGGIFIARLIDIPSTKNQTA